METTRNIVDAQWVDDVRDDGDYSCYITPAGWCSFGGPMCGDEWVWGGSETEHAAGSLVDDDDFSRSTIRLVGGPRDGVLVS